MRILRLLAALVLSAPLLTACGDPADDGKPYDPGSSTSTTSSVSPSNSSTPSSSSSASPSSSLPPFTNGPVIVNRTPSVPPIPILTDIRPAQHPEAGYDRVTFDFDGNDNAELPGYRVEYVDNPTDCGTGDPSNVNGRRFLQITFDPTDAHSQEGESTVTRERSLGFPQIESYKVTCDFEAKVVVVLGLDDVVGFRVGELSNRIYVDVAA